MNTPKHTPRKKTSYLQILIAPMLLALMAIGSIAGEYFHYGQQFEIRPASGNPSA